MMTVAQSLAIPWWKDQRASSAELMGFVGELLSGTEDIRANVGYAIPDLSVDRRPPPMAPKTRVVPARLCNVVGY